MMVPKKTLGMSTEYGRTNTEKTFTFVNKRPVELKQVEKVLRSAFSEAAGLEVEKNPVAVVSIIVGR